jgi:hypothetical protein
MERSPGAEGPLCEEGEEGGLSSLALLRHSRPVFAHELQRGGIVEKRKHMSQLLFLEEAVREGGVRRGRARRRTGCRGH